MEYETIQVDVDGKRGTLTFDRPEKKNALNPELYSEAAHALDGPLSNAEVLVITGAGDSFCSGNDLVEYFKEPRREGPQKRQAVRETAGATLRKLNGFPGMTIAKIHGWATAEGFAIQARCDFAIASESATFCLSEINFGTFPGAGATWSARRVMNERDAMYYCATGETFTATEAAEMGVVNAAVPEPELEERVETLVDTLLEKDALALQFLKDVFYKGAGMDYEEARDFELAKSDQMRKLQGDSLDEGIDQFEKDAYRPGAGESFEKD